MLCCSGRVGRLRFKRPRCTFGPDSLIEPNRLQADIKHEEIKGFMAAMTMPYKVGDAKELADLKPGDLITSTLVVVTNDAYLKDVKKAGEAPAGDSRRCGAVSLVGI